MVTAHLGNIAGLGRLYPGTLTYLALFLLFVPAYLLLALKRVYGQPWTWTAIKCGLLVLFYFLLIQPVLLATFVLVLRAM